MAADGGSWNNLPSVILLEIFSYLRRNDRINASTTCRHWRLHFYHAALWRNMTFKIESHDKNTIARTRFLTSCFAKKLRNATVKFDSLDPICVDEAAKVVKKLSKNPELRKFHLKPTNCRIECPGGHGALKQFWNSQGLRMLRKIASSYCLQELTLGCMEDVTSCSQSLLEQLAFNQSSSLRVLGLASLKDDPDDYLLPELDGSLFQNFQQLQILSMDYDNLDDRLLLALKSRQMQRLIVHVHGIADSHPNTTDGAWQIFKKNNPMCELRLTLIHSYDAVKVLHNTVLRPSMPLTDLRAFFCEQLNISALHQMSIWYSNTLRSIHWVDSLQSPDCDVLVDLGEIPNPLIMCSWRCSKLEEIVLLGYKVWDLDLYAVARLRGKTLRRVDVWQGDILLDRPETYSELEQELSSKLGKPWKAREDLHLDDVILNPCSGDSDEYILPLVDEDLSL